MFLKFHKKPLCFMLGMLMLLSFFILVGCSTLGTQLKETSSISKATIVDLPDDFSSISKTTIVDLSDNLSEYFEGINSGTAIFYNHSEYFVYNEELSQLRTSPCSTFKIISGLMGLENGAIDPVNSVKKWNGTNYPVESWNKDIGFEEAFNSSCIWYYKGVVEQLGKEAVQNTLKRLNYGNYDISQWEGSLNNLVFPDIKNLEEINGFWQQSSLKISPKEQVDVLAKIFTDKDVFSKSNIELMKEVMRFENGDSNIKIYGKTGTGFKDDTWIDAWYVGMFEQNGEVMYFAVRLNDPGSTSTKARDIAINIINNYFVK